MSLEEDLKARTLALISQQMANWVVEIQNNIRQHQANLVATLDELQETVARYDEKIDEAEVETAMAEVVASQPPAESLVLPEPVVPTGPGLDRIRKSLADIEKGASLSEVLTALVHEVASYTERAAMFIVKGTNAIGWYGRGFDQNEIVKQLTIPLNADTVFRIVQNSRHALRGHVSHSPGTAHALARLGGNPQGILAVPLILRDKLAAVMYCDSQQEELPQEEALAIEILTLFAGKNIDLISLAPKPTAAGAPAPAAARPTTTTAGISADRAAGLRSAVEEARAAPRQPGPASVPPTPPAVGGAGAEASSTVMFNASQFAALRQQQAPPAPSRHAPPPPPAAAPGVSPEEQKAHEDAKRFARLVVSEIKLYNEAKVNEGRRQRDLYDRLKDDIERGRQMYADRVPAHIREHTNYFVDELVRILAGGDAAALGHM